MNDLILWVNNEFKITYSENKYSLLNNNKIILDNYDSLIPCDNYFIIACKKNQKSYLYQLFNINGEKIFGDDRTFELISFDSYTKKFILYNYFNKFEIVIPKLSENGYKLFYMFLRQIYDKDIIQSDNIQKTIDEISNKIENLSENDINEIIENIELANTLYIKLNKPSYLKNCLIVIDDESKSKLLNTININHSKICEELAKDIINDKRIYELNKDLIHNLITFDYDISLNQVLNILNNAQDLFREQMDYYMKSRNELFVSIESIKNYFQSKDTIKYFDKNDFKYLISNRNLFLNVMYNKSNTDILNLLKKYNIS